MSKFLVTALCGLVFAVGFTGSAVGGVPTEQAQADFFQVVYPVDPSTISGTITPLTPVSPFPDTSYWTSLGITSTPQCEPCNHEGTPSIDADDFHDHVLDSMPTNKGYSPIWHVYLVFPTYTGVAAVDQAINVEYAKHLPTKSESAVVNLLATTTVFNATTYPVAQIIDTGVFFLCAVVSPHAVH